MEKKSVCIIVFFVITLSIVTTLCYIGKENQTKTSTSVEQERENKMTNPVSNDALDIIVSSLNECSDSEFYDAYEKVSDEYEFEVCEELSKSGKMKKKDLKRVKAPEIYASGKKFNLRGLRFFNDLYGLHFHDASLVGMKEWNPSTLKNVTFENCFFDIATEDIIEMCNGCSELTFEKMNIPSLDCLRKVKRIGPKLTFFNTKISDISYLKNFTYKDINKLDLSGNCIKDVSVFGNFSKSSLCLNLNYNLIEDISVLSKLKKKRLILNLAGNLISDISVFEDFEVPLRKVDISDNRIMEVAPLKNALGEDTECYLENNSILDYTQISDFMDKYYFKNHQYYTGEKQAKLFRFDKPPKFILQVDDKPVKKEKFVYFGVMEAYYGDIDTPQPAMNIRTFVDKVGGTSCYDLELGILKVHFKDKQYEFRDYRNTVEVNGKVKKFTYDLRRMAGNLPYMSIQDICQVFGLKVKREYGRSYYVDFGDGTGQRLNYINKMNVSLS